MDPGSSSLDPLPEGIPSNAMTPEQKEGRLADGDCADGQDHGDANIQWHKLSFKELTWVQLYTYRHMTNDIWNCLSMVMSLQVARRSGCGGLQGRSLFF